MLCAACGDHAVAVCQFCGSGVCAKERKSGRFVTGFRAQGQAGWGRIPNTVEDYLVVPAATWCGACQVQAVYRA